METLSAQAEHYKARLEALRDGLPGTAESIAFGASPLPGATRPSEREVTTHSTPTLPKAGTYGSTHQHQGRHEPRTSTKDATSRLGGKHSTGSPHKEHRESRGSVGNPLGASGQWSDRGSVAGSSPRREKMPYIPVSTRAEHGGHGRMLRPRGFADFELPTSIIPDPALSAPVRLDTVKLWPERSHAAPQAVIDTHKGPREILRDEIEAIKAASAHIPRKKGLRAVHASIMDWHLESFPGARPVERKDVYKLENWLKAQLRVTTEEARKLEHRLTHEATALSWSLEEQHNGSNWTLQGHAWREWMQCMLGFQEIYAQAYRELVRQVACQCVERGALMDSVMSGMMELLNLAWNAFLKSATAADRLRERIAHLEGTADEGSEKENELQRLQAEVHILTSELDRSEGRIASLHQQLEGARNEAKQKKMRRPSGGRPEGEGAPAEGAPAEGGEGAAAEGAKKPEGAAVAKKDDESVDEVQEMDERMNELKDELQKALEAHERAQASEEAAWAEKQQLERLMQSYTPRPKHSKEEPVKSITTTGPQETSAKVERVEKEMVLMHHTIQQLQADLDYYKALAAASTVQEFVWEEAFKRLQDVDGEPRPYFLGFGEEHHIPRFLRSKNPRIENHKMSKRDVELLIKDIWKAKKDADKEVTKQRDKGAQRAHLRDFLYTYFMEQHGDLEDKITSVAYNLMWGCKRYDYDADIELFVNVLMDEVHEDVYHDQMQLMDDMLFVYRALDERTNGRVLGAVTLADFEGMLRDFFHAKSDQAFDEMIECTEEDLRVKAPTQWEQKVVAYEMLFEEDENLDQGPFAECVRDQHLKSRTAFIEETRKGLAALSEGAPITPKMCQQVLLENDPGMKPKLVNEYIARGFHVSQKQLLEKFESLQQPMGVFIKNLKSGVIAPKARADAKGKGGKGGKGDKGKARRNSFVLIMKALKTYQGEEGSDDEDEGGKKDKKGGKKGK